MCILIKAQDYIDHISTFTFSMILFYFIYVFLMFSLFHILISDCDIVIFVTFSSMGHVF